MRFQRSEEKANLPDLRKEFVHLQFSSHTMQKLLDDYYKYRGWNMDGIPEKETLEKLQLGYIAEDFAKRGIL